MKPELIDLYFTYQPPVADQIDARMQLRDAAKTFAQIANMLTPECADQTAGMRKLREAVTTFNQAIMFRGK